MMLRSLFIVATLLMASPVMASLRVFTCEPEWAALVSEIAPDASVTSATTGFQDPHYIQARPALIAKVRRADLVMCTGSDLEIGWLPLLLRQASNPEVHPGRIGFLEASAQVDRLEIPESVDRSGGDLHPNGNPHVQLNPHNIAIIARVLADRLAELDPESADEYMANHDRFAQRWQAAIADWEHRAAGLRGTPTISHHRSWVYLNAWLGLEEVGNLEPLPGIPPTTSHLSSLIARAEQRDVRIIIRAAYQDARGSEWLSGRTEIPAVVIPHTVGSTDSATDLFTWYDELIDRLLEHAG
jgi:zinc/manganese transport system substrate-binding protein